MNEPLISIVVPTLNQAAFIEQTLLSIAGQRWPRLEIIVVDGGSTDGTAEIVGRFGDVVTTFISEPDKGQADAINKGMRLAKGEILAWLNSDDYYLPGALINAARALGDPSVPRLVYGSCLLLWEMTGAAKAAAPQPFDRERLKTCDLIHQPAAFWTRALWGKAGELDSSRHYTLDWEWWLRASEHGEVLTTPELLAVYRFHPAHKSSGGHQRRTTEVVELIRQNASRDWIAAFEAVAGRLDRMRRTWERFAVNGNYRLHKLAHLDLYLRHGAKIDEVFWQLHV